MSEKMIENNKVSVIGEIISGFTFSHEVFGEGFYMVDVAVNRLSEQADVRPLMISERLIDVEANYIGCTMEALDSSVPITGMKGRKTAWFCPSSCVRSISWRNLRIIRKQIRFFWMDIYVRPLYTERLLWAERSRIFCSP